MILTVDELNRLDAIYRMFPAPRHIQHASAEAFAAVAQVLDATDRTQFLCAFASTHAVGAVQLFQTLSQRAIFYVNASLLSVNAAKKMFSSNFQSHGSQLRLEDDVYTERFAFALELLPLAGGHPRLISALAYEGARAASDPTEASRRSILVRALSQAGLTAGDFNQDIVFAALRGELLPSHAVITTAPVLNGASVLDGAITFDFLTQRGYYQYVHNSVCASVPVIAPMRLELFALKEIYPWCKRLTTILEQRHTYQDFEKQVLHLLALHLEIAAEVQAKLPILEFFGRQRMLPARSKIFNEDACIPLLNKRVLVKKCKHFSDLATQVPQVKEDELWVVSFENRNEPGFDVVLLYKVGKVLFSVCLEMKSQVGATDHNMTYNILSAKFGEFQKQVTKFSKLQRGTLLFHSHLLCLWLYFSLPSCLRKNKKVSLLVISVNRSGIQAEAQAGKCVLGLHHSAHAGQKKFWRAHVRSSPPFPRPERFFRDARISFHKRVCDGARLAGALLHSLTPPRRG